MADTRVIQLVKFTGTDTWAMVKDGAGDEQPWKLFRGRPKDRGLVDADLIGLTVDEAMAKAAM